MTYVSLIISILAVLVAVVTVFSHREHTDAVLAQARASDRWGEYQGRRSREFQLGLASDTLTLPTAAPSAAVLAKLRDYKARQIHIEEELAEDGAEARALEGEVGIAERKAARLDFSEALLQISVVLASITLLTRRSWYVAAALTLGTIGIVAAVSAFLLR